MRSSINNITYSAIFVALIIVCAQIVIPLPSGVPLTLQTFAIALTGYCLKTVRSFIIILVYILLGVTGVPVFSSLHGGLGVITGYSGGFIIGFIPLAIMCSLAGKVKLKSVKIAFSLIGIVLCHLIGTIYFSFYTNTSVVKAVITSSLPYIFKDIILMLLAYIISRRIKKQIKL